MKHRLVLLCALGLLALAALPALAAAGTVYKTTTTMRVSPTKVEGTLSSEKAACVKNRELAARIFVIGGTPGAPFTVKTDSSGQWSFEIDLPSSAKGQVDVRVIEKRLGGGKSCGGTEKRLPF